VHLETQSGGMDMSRVASWRPTFPEPAPAHWVCFVGTGDSVRVASDTPLGSVEREWLGQWLSAHQPREAEVEASYVYLGLARDWRSQKPDGQESDDAVVGVGSGIGFGEPPDASESTIGDLWQMSIVELQRDG
jgi:hypothetical protein